MEEFDKLIDHATKIFNAPAATFRTAYEHQNALQAQLEKLDDAERKLQPFSGGRSDEVRSSLNAIRRLITEKVSTTKSGKSPSNRTSPSKQKGAATSTSGATTTPQVSSSLPGSEEWLRQLQAEDEVDQEHERRNAKQRAGKGRGSHNKPPGSRKVAHGAGAAAGEIGTQRDAKNAEKHKLGTDLQSRLVHLVHPTSEANLLEAAEYEGRNNKNHHQQHRAQQKPQHHETHRECKFGVISQKILSTGAKVTNMEGQPFVELAFEAQKRLAVPTASILLASNQEQQINHNSNNNNNGGFFSSSVASQVGYIVGGPNHQNNINNKSGGSSRRSTPRQKNTKSPARNNNNNRLSPGLGPSSSLATKSPNLIGLDQQLATTLVDCETKVQMYRSVFDVIWALQSANTKGEINLDMETIMDAKSAEILAAAIPVPIGGTGAAAAKRKLGGVASVDDYSTSSGHDDNNNNNNNTVSQTPHFGSRATTREYAASSKDQKKYPVSPNPTDDDSSFPTLGGGGNSNNNNVDTASTVTPIQKLPPANYTQNNNTKNDDDEDEDQEDDADDSDEDFLDDDDDDETQQNNDNDNDQDEDDDDDYDVHKIAAKLARENKERDGGDGGIDFTEDEDFFSKAKGIMTQTNELVAPPGTLPLVASISNAPWTVILVQGGYCAAAVFVQGIPIIHKAFHRYVVRKKQGGKQSNQEGIAGSAGSQIRKAQEKKFNEDVQVLLDAWRNLIDASWFIFYSAPSPSNRKLLVTFNDKIVKAAFTEKSTMHDQAQSAEAKLATSTSVFKKSDPNASPIRFDDPRVKSVPLTTKRPVFGEVLRVYETLSRCTMRIYYKENEDDENEESSSESEVEDQ